MSNIRNFTRQKPGVALSTCILIVDGDRPASIALAFMLNLRGYDDVRSVRSAARAMAIAENFSPGIIFLDVEVAGADTRELAKKIGKCSRHLSPRLIALSSQAEVPADGARESVFERYLLKPCEQVEVDKVLRLPAGYAA
jgi:two-component SAPR family response regulator